jgi:hypothetical protein
MPWALALARLSIDVLPDGPTAHERETDTHVVLLDVEDRFHDRIIDWRWHTPNPDDLTARVVVEIARTVAVNRPSGWVTPSAVLNPTKASLTPAARDEGYLRGCRLAERGRPVARRVR